MTVVQFSGSGVPVYCTLRQHCWGTAWGRCCSCFRPRPGLPPVHPSGRRVSRRTASCWLWRSLSVSVRPAASVSHPWLEEFFPRCIPQLTLLEGGESPSETTPCPPRHWSCMWVEESRAVGVLESWGTLCSGGVPRGLAFTRVLRLHTGV